MDVAHDAGSTRRRARSLGVVAGWLMTAVLVGIGSIAWGRSPSEAIRVPSAPSQQLLDTLEREFPDQAGGRVTAVFSNPNGALSDPTAGQAVHETVRAIAALPGVRSVLDPTGPAAALFTSSDGTTAWAPVVYRQGAFEIPRTSLDDLVRTGRIAERAGLKVGFGGQPIERPDPTATHTGEIIGLVVALVVLWAALRTLGAALLPLVVAGTTVGFGFAITRLVGSITDVNVATQSLCSMVGLAVGIDYSMLIVSRFQAGLAAGLDPHTALRVTRRTAGRATAFAGATVVVSLLGLVIIAIPAMAVLAGTVSLTVLIAVAASVTLLPALLVLAGPVLDAAPFPGRRRRSVARSASGSPRAPSTRWAAAVCRHPVVATGAGIVTLALLAVPTASLHTAFPDAHHRPVGDTARTAFDLMTDAFGVGANAPLIVAIPSADPTRVADAQRWLARLDGVIAVSPALTNRSGDLHLVQVQPVGGPEAIGTADLVRRIRSESTRGVGTPLEVTGATAFYVDLDEALRGRLGWFIATVLVLSLVVLTAVFRAPLVAVKAALLNAAGIAASYGVVVAVFQWGWLRQLVGIEAPLPVASPLPVMLFAVLFGLSMDYEVFILSRVREAWDRTHDNTRAVIDGLAGSALVVTAAATIMFGVFAGFTTADVIEIKMVGFGLAVAVLLDATVIRQVLVPATMTLLGRRNWWIPRWLDRALPHLDIDGSDGPPPPSDVGALDASANPARDLADATVV